MIGGGSTKELASVSRMARAEYLTFVVGVFGGTGANGSAREAGAAKARAKKTVWMVRMLLTYWGIDWRMKYIENNGIQISHNVRRELKV